MTDIFMISLTCARPTAHKFPFGKIDDVTQVSGNSDQNVKRWIIVNPVVLLRK